MEIKIAFFDIDGTLVELGKQQLSSNTKKALLGLQEKGIKICLATGRALMTIPNFEGVTFDAIIAYNGSYCYAKDDVIYKNQIPTKTVKQIINNATKIGRAVAVATLSQIASNGYDRDLEDYFRIADEAIPPRENFDSLLNEEVYQLMSGGRKDEYEKLLAGVNDAIITAWWDRAVDIIPANGSKAKGIEKVLEYFGLKKEEAMAFGDGSNDIPMLLSAGTGIAMGNATEDVKQIANEVCDTAEHDGIYFYCKQHGLIE